MTKLIEPLHLLDKKADSMLSNKAESTESEQDKLLKYSCHALCMRSDPKAEVLNREGKEPQQWNNGCLKANNSNEWLKLPKQII